MAPIQVSFDRNDIINKQANPDSNGRTEYKGTLKPPSLRMSSRLRSGMIPNETIVKAKNVPMLTWQTDCRANATELATSK